MSERPYHVLFLCTGNSARSILAEALLNHWGRGRFVAYSAGSHPTGKVNPYALATLRQIQNPTHTARSKGWDEFALNEGHGPEMDLIITLCDEAAGEVCPIWPGCPLTAHWGIADPAMVRGSDAQNLQAFGEAYATLQARIKGLIQLPIKQLGAEMLKERINELGALSASAVR
jgi:arsenate reductase (thioredoxin)